MPTREVSKVIAVLIAENGSYTYVDKISQAPSKALALMSIRDALRDYHSLASRGTFSNNVVKDFASSINFDQVTKEIDSISQIDNTTKLREELSLISAEALSLSARLASNYDYKIADQIAKYAKANGVKTVEDLEKFIESNVSKIAKDLDLDEDKVNSIGKNKRLLNYVFGGE
ncbi:hypothetical protein [Acidianus sp. RZ1]|uniref:hypothetical protein n=1 Tax=Acidianus sp. RZ1 TaxID=1540082 RepID=UPI0014912BC3|nr:hypothetical protein [Acidianus sp. RZ1]NON61641.1 hypothetical protein [Acidianus sp. RZ1]